MPKQDILPLNTINVSTYLWICVNKRNTFLLLIGVILTIVLVTTNPIQAQTGKGTDIFKVIMTIFGVDESKGDVVAIVTVKDEQAKVKLFDASGPAVVPLSNVSEGGGHLIEYVATFPNLTVNAGDKYNACVTTVKDLELICKSGNNSPAARPEFVDISLNASSGNVEQVTVEEEGSSEEEAGDETDEAEEENDVSPGIPPIG
jgi:hypothetical protein